MIAGLILINLVSLSASPLVIDSTVYNLDLTNKTLQVQRLNRNIIDYCIDNDLFALTDRYLYKIDPDNLIINDRIPLAQRFNHITIAGNKLILISAQEIVILNKNNLAFESGIGIEAADYQPLIDVQGLSIVKHKPYLYLITNTSKKTIIKVYNILNGLLSHQISTSLILDYLYNEIDHQIITFDKNKRLIFYNENLKKIKTVKTGIDAQYFTQFENGYLIYNNQGLFFINNKGTLIDYQPIPGQKHTSHGKFFFFPERAIVFIDSVTLRPALFLQNKENIKKIFYLDNLQYVLGLNPKSNFYLIDINNQTFEPITEQKQITQQMKVEESMINQDSLWYFQVGAFNNYENAHKVYDKYWTQQLPVFIDSSDLYRIKLGGFRQRKEAIEIIEHLQLNGWFVLEKKVLRDTTIKFNINSQEYLLENGIIERSKL